MQTASVKCELDFRNNCFNLIRLLAALQVFFGHAVRHLKLSAHPIFDFGFSLFAGVPIFFFLSGFLIWHSLERCDVKLFFKKRALRLFPELWLGVALSLLSIFLLYDNIVIGDIALFALAQSSFLQFWSPDSLNGFGVGTPNGSLWTISVFIQFYIAVIFIKRFMKNRKGLAWWLPILALLTAINVLSPFIEARLPSILGKLYSMTLLPYLWLFMLGAFVSEYFEHSVLFLKRFWWIFLLGFYSFKLVGIELYGAYPVFTSILSCAVCVGFAYAFPKLNLKQDFSYGIYIYHMVIVNIALELGFSGNWAVFLAVLATTVALSAISRLIFAKKV